MTDYDELREKGWLTEEEVSKSVHSEGRVIFVKHDGKLTSLHMPVSLDERKAYVEKRRIARENGRPICYEHECEQTVTYWEHKAGEEFCDVHAQQFPVKGWLHKL